MEAKLQLFCKCPHLYIKLYPQFVPNYSKGVEVASGAAIAEYSTCSKRLNVPAEGLGTGTLPALCTANALTTETFILESHTTFLEKGNSEICLRLTIQQTAKERLQAAGTSPLAHATFLPNCHTVKTAANIFI